MYHNENSVIWCLKNLWEVTSLLYPIKNEINDEVIKLDKVISVTENLDKAANSKQDIKIAEPSSAGIKP